MGEKLKLVAVSYLNTKPFMHGLENGVILNDIDCQVDTPANCADQLMNGQADIGLVPVAMLPHIPQAKIISDFCIGCDGAVGTVALFSNQPIEKLTEIYLDYQSRSSVQLLKILVKEYWKLNPTYLESKPGFETTATANQGVLVIGDRAMDLEEKYQYKYDLGEAWKQHTNLPFVFAAWVSTKEVTDEFLDRFNASLAIGLDCIPTLIKSLDNRVHFSLTKYYKEYLSFDLTAEKFKALNIFLNKIGFQLEERMVRPLELGEA